MAHPRCDGNNRFAVKPERPLVASNDYHPLAYKGRSEGYRPGERELGIAPQHSVRGVYKGLRSETTGTGTSTK